MNGESEFNMSNYWMYWLNSLSGNWDSMSDRIRFAASHIGFKDEMYQLSGMDLTQGEGSALAEQYVEALQQYADGQNEGMKQDFSAITDYMATYVEDQFADRTAQITDEVQLSTENAKKHSHKDMWNLKLTRISLPTKKILPMKWQKKT